ncbi:hypothetical protein LINGRAHAP2_LOCUS26408, partial [Linum grandiflorum]
RRFAQIARITSSSSSSTAPTASYAVFFGNYGSRDAPISNGDFDLIPSQFSPPPIRTRSCQPSTFSRRLCRSSPKLTLTKSILADWEEKNQMVFQ